MRSTWANAAGGASSAIEGYFLDRRYPAMPLKDLDPVLGTLRTLNPLKVKCGAWRAA